MRQTIRALTWAIAILWIITLILPMTIGLSLLQLAESKSIGFRDPVFTYSNGIFYLSAPFYINNTGFYDLSDINITINVGDKSKTVARFSQIFPTINAGSMLNESYDVAIGLAELLSNDEELLTNDTTLNLNMHLFFRVAYLIGFGGQANATASWGAPFYNLTVLSSPYNYTFQKISFTLSFVNHAYFPVDGMMALEIRNSRNELLGTFSPERLYVVSYEAFSRLYELSVDPAEITSSGTVRVYFDDVQILNREVVLA